MGLTQDGYRRRTYDEILQSKIERAEQLFGKDIDTSDLTPLGKYIRINAYDQALTEEEAEAIYYSRFPNTATGTSLDRLCVFVGISRNAAKPARFAVKVTGTTGEIVPIGFLVGTEQDINFYNLMDTEIGADGTCEISVDCVQPGIIGNVKVSDITQIVNPNAFVTKIECLSQVEVGEEIESDYNLRKRFEQAREGSGACNENAIRAALMRVPTVTSAGLIVNESDETVDGRPPRSFECFVSGGENYHNEIAQTIFDKKPLGIKTTGQVSVGLLDDGGYEHTIKFSHTSKIYVTVAVSIITDATFEDDGKSLIEQNIRTYIDSLGVGNPVILTTLYSQIYAVPGVVEVTDLRIGKEPDTPTTSNIEVAEYEVATFREIEWGD